MKKQLTIFDLLETFDSRDLKYISEFIREEPKDAEEITKQSTKENIKDIPSVGIADIIIKRIDTLIFNFINDIETIYDLDSDKAVVLDKLISVRKYYDTVQL